MSFYQTLFFKTNEYIDSMLSNFVGLYFGFVNKLRGQ